MPFGVESEKFVGFRGTEPAVTEAGADIGLWPNLFFAYTLKEYSVPITN
jgi:hypothetical protein